jgi:hypothetical protein
MIEHTRIHRSESAPPSPTPAGTPCGCARRGPARCQARSAQTGVRGCAVTVRPICTRDILLLAPALELLVIVVATSSLAAAGVASAAGRAGRAGTAAAAHVWVQSCGMQHVKTDCWWGSHLSKSNRHSQVPQCPELLPMATHAQQATVQDSLTLPCAVCKLALLCHVLPPAPLVELVN